MARINRICVVGNTASGKSFFARQAGAILGLPVSHLDQIYWRADWSHIDRMAFLARQKELIACLRWVVDGCFSECGIKERFQAADAVVFIDQPALACAQRAIVRRETGHQGLSAGADDRKMSWRRGLAFLAEILLFRFLDRPCILRAASQANTPLYMIHDWNEEAGLLAELNCG